MIAAAALLPWAWRPVRRAILILCLGGLSACSESATDVSAEPSDDARPQLSVAGATMGTSWSATWTSAAVSEAVVQQAVSEELDRFNKLMSTWDPASELSLFNQSTAIEPVALHADTLYVIDVARRLSQITDGRYDITLAPVIQLWGFDGKQAPVTPDEQAIEDALRMTGSRQLVRVDNTVRKRHAKVAVDVSSLAKGYAVDKLGELLEGLDIADYLVEIGGEVRARGARSDGAAWRIGIENPDGQMLDGLLINDGHVATSGSYRNFRLEAGKRVSHIIDGASGRPVTHNLVAVTVVHDSTMLADAWSTALMVVGESDAQELIDTYGLTARMVVHDQGEFRIVQTPSFSRLQIRGSS